VLTLDEAAADEHIAQRGVYTDLAGFGQPAPAPRFSETPGALTLVPPAPGEHTREALVDWGFDDQEISARLEDGTLVATTPAS
jgi:alpha-methylacyl-CoA racemase